MMDAVIVATWGEAFEVSTKLLELPDIAQVEIVSADDNVESLSKQDERYVRIVRCQQLIAGSWYVLTKGVYYDVSEESVEEISIEIQAREGAKVYTEEMGVALRSTPHPVGRKL